MPYVRDLYYRDLGAGTPPIVALHGGWGYEFYPFDDAIAGNLEDISDDVVLVELPLTYSVRSILRSETGDIDGALDDARAAVESYRRFYPRDRWSYVSRQVLLLAVAERYDEAAEVTEALRTALEESGRSDKLYRLAAARLEHAQGNHTAALEHLQQIPEGHRGIFVNALMIRVYLAAGHVDDAVTLGEKLLSSYTSNRRNAVFEAITLHYHLGRAYEATARYDDAIEQYNTFLGHWGDADVELASVTDARRRLARLKSRS